MDLAHLLGGPPFYGLRRLDLTVETALDAKKQEQTTRILRGLVILDAPLPKGLAALITSISSLVWALRRKP